MGRINIEIEDFQAAELLSANEKRINELNASITEQTKQLHALLRTNERIKAALNGTSIFEVAPATVTVAEIDKYSWRTEIRNYFQNHQSESASAKTISKHIVKRDGVTDVKEIQKITNNISIALSTLRAKGELSFVSKNNSGDSVYELIKKEGVNPL